MRIIAGYVSTALFLPMVAMGMHHGLVALYSVQLESFGYVTPVSYTHLDVYKRQIIGIEKSPPKPFRELRKDFGGDIC